MPWKEDEEGKTYIPSLYSKDELPTWHEIYHDFYKKKLTIYDPRSKQNEIDPYWKLPKFKVLLSFICNQLNKMMFEDKKGPDEFLDGTLKWENLYFILIENPALIKETIYASYGNDDGPPKIYTIPIPSTNQQSIFVTRYPRIDINTLTGRIELVAVLTNLQEEIKPIDQDTFWKLIEYILHDVISYFEPTIGWKDDQGNIISSKQPEYSKCEKAGYDPAL